jgi:hypothetical protein
MEKLCQPNKDYAQARHEICAHTFAAVSSLAGSIDYLAEQIEKKPQVLSKWLSAYNSRVGLKFIEAGGTTHASLAAQEHYNDIFDRLVEIFERLSPQIEIEAKINAYLYYAERDTITEITAVRQEIAEFKMNYAPELTAEIASDAYQRDQKLIHDSVSDLHRASHGQWTPELVRCENPYGNGPEDLESPSSSALRDIAENVRAGRLRLPPAFLSPNQWADSLSRDFSDP